jgi:hypothetical protein
VKSCLDTLVLILSMALSPFGSSLSVSLVFSVRVMPALHRLSFISFHPLHECQHVLPNELRCVTSLMPSRCKYSINQALPKLDSISRNVAH